MRPAFRRRLATLDAWSARWSMYRWTAAALGLIAGCGLIAAAAGQLLATPAELLASLGVSTVTCLAANRACAWLWRAPVRYESALVTALVLHLIAWPGLDPQTLLALVLAGVLATVGKYLLAVRGRRLANPAAFGLFATGLLGLGSGNWWVASPALFPVVAIAAVAVLRRSGAGAPAMAALAAGSTLLVARLTWAGAPPAQAALTALTSYPILFLAAFMVTDPQLFPPRRWQQLLVGALAGGLVAAPIGIGDWRSSPEVAVLAGNLLGWALSAGRGASAGVDVVRRRKLAGDLVEVTLRSSRPVRFLPGQFVELTASSAPSGRGNRRVFSLTSPPAGDARELTIAFHAGAPRSAFKQSLLAPGPQTRLRAESVRGDLVPPRRPDVPLLLVAAGVGVTPFVSFAAAFAERPRDVVLLYCVRSADDLIYPAQLSGWRVVVVSPDGGPLPEGWTHAPAAELTAAVVLRHCPDAADRTGYVAGSPAAVAHLTSTLAAAGVRRIHSERLVGA